MGLRGPGVFGPHRGCVSRHNPACGPGRAAKRKLFSVEQITALLQQVSGGRGRCLPAGGLSEQTFYRWKKAYGGMLPGEAQELKQLRDENTKLKRPVADLSLDKAMLQGVVQKTF